MVILVYIVFIFAISFLSVLEVFLSFGHARRVSAMSGAFFQKVEMYECNRVGAVPNPNSLLIVVDTDVI